MNRCTKKFSLKWGWTSKMKILEIKLKNLNSLRGEWTINLADNEYKANGIFAVTGSTGAGKTTIFDAVCLALYGRTPRLARITASSNEIMSRGTGECFAHVKFSTEEGIFVCKWWQARTGGKPKGTLMSPNHHLEKYIEGQEEGVSISTQPKATLKEVERLTGMEFGQFTQAILLAQGDFDAFLNGNATTRSKILELLTGIDVYSEISRNIALRTGKEKNKLDEAKIKRDSSIPHDNLGTDEEISRDIHKTRELLTSAEESFKNLQEELNWLKLIRDIKDELLRNEAAIKNHERVLADFTRERARLEAGLRAKNILPVYSELTAKRKQYAKDKASCEAKRQEIMNDSTELRRLESELLPQCEERLKRLTAGIPDGKSPDVIRSEVSRLVKSFSDNYKDKKSSELDKAKAEKTLKDAQAQSDSARKEEDEARNKVNELLNVRVSVVLASERTKLKPGMTCPLCGGLVRSDSLRRIAGDSTGGDFSFDEELRAAQKRFNDASRASQKAQAEQASCAERLEACREKILECEAKNLEIKSSILEIITPLGIVNQKSCEEITIRINKWFDEAVKLNEAITDIKGKIQSLSGKNNANRKSLDDSVSALSVIETELKELQERFVFELKMQNFSDEKNFTASILSDTELSRLQALSKTYDDKMTELQGIKDDRTKRLKEEEDKAVSTKTLDDVKTLYNERDNEIKTLSDKLSRLVFAAEARDKLKSEFDRLDKEYQAQEKIYNNWSAFDKELGQLNGGKLGSFAQKITLRFLIELANEQLRKMNGRYTLKAPSENDGNLEISVIDSEQAGEIRPTSNLSGGERFIISLALALGLSQISGAKAKVESLFIDEGFGSLDDDSLNAALEALGEIKREGRMIGIISHVSGISERISTKINVIRKNEGTSVLEGPGCSRIKERK